MNDYLRTDQYTYLGRSCPVRTELHPVDDLVEIVFGEYRFGGDTLRLVINDPDTLLSLTETLGEARTRLTQHLRAKAHPDPAMSQVDRAWIGPVANWFWLREVWCRGPCLTSCQRRDHGTYSTI